MAAVVLVVVVWGPKGSVASCRADVLVVKHYSLFYVLSVCSRCTVLGSRRGALLVVWWGVTRWAGAAPFRRVVVVVVEGVLVHSTSCAAPFGLGAGKQRRLLSGD